MFTSFVQKEKKKVTSSFSSNYDPDFKLHKCCSRPFYNTHTCVSIVGFLSSLCVVETETSFGMSLSEARARGQTSAAKRRHRLVKLPNLFFAKQLSRSFQCFWRLKPRDCICFSNVAPSKPKRTQWWEQYEAVEIKSVWMKFISLCVCVCAGDMQCGCVLEASSKFKFEACACQVPISVSLHIPSIMFFRHFWYRLWFSTVRLLYLMLACIMFCWLYYISSFAGHRKNSD